MASLTLLLRIALAALALHIVYGGVNHVQLPNIDPNEWWGPGNGTGSQDTTIRNYVIKFDASMISDLKSRLLSHREFKKPLEGVGFTYGTNSTALEFWIQYLANQYPFDERQTYLNQYPHYTTKIQGLNIHFMRIKAQRAADDIDDVDAFNKKLVPIMFLHGWPGSIREFYETIPILVSTAKAKGISLDIIIPSLPGYGFSDGAVRPGMGCDKVAIVLRNLMHRIGYSQYYVQAGDMGALIASTMATYFPTEVLGYHTNFPLVHTPSIIFNLIIGNYHKEEIAPSNLLDRLYPSWDVFFNIMTNMGYLHEQATKPDTLGFGLSDSPSALMGYIFEKFTYQVRKNFIDLPDGGLAKVFTPIQLLDNIMIYWSTNSITTAIRLYAETFNKRYVGLRLNEIRSLVPIWVLQAPDELMYLPPWMIKQKFPYLLNETLPSEGGHFYAWEKPQSFAQDVVNAIVAFRNWHAMNSTLHSRCSIYIDE